MNRVLKNKPKTVKTTIKQAVVDDLTLRDYSSSLLAWDEIESERIDCDQSIYVGENEIANFLSVEATSCCGVIELKELRYNNYTKPNKIDNNLKHLTKALDNIVKTNKRTFVIYTNGIQSSKKWEYALERSESFTLVKEFKNPGSGNTIKMWVSNN